MEYSKSKTKLMFGNVKWEIMIINRLDFMKLKNAFRLIIVIK